MRYRIARALLRIPDGIEDRHLTLLAAVALASFFEEYDLAMLTSALKYIAADLGLAEKALPDTLAAIRLGAIPAFVFIPYADRVGRRRVFLLSIVAMGVLTLLTALSRTATEFVILQMLTRTFFVAGSAVAFVFIAEEFPARHRGFGIGLLGALAMSGHGVSAILFSLIDHLPFGWRLLYAVGGLPLLLYPYFSRRIPETRRFAELREQGASLAKVGALSWLAPLGDLVRQSPLRALGIALGGLLPSFGIIATLQLTGYFTQTVHGYTAAQYAAMIVVAGGVGVLGNLLAGRAADHFGRRLVGALLLAAFPFCALLFYRGTAWMLPVALALCIFSAQGGRSILRALSTELFPTSYRGAASGMFTILDVFGAAVGLFVLGRLVGGPGELALKVPWIAAITGLGAIVVLLLPETSQRELESLS